MLLALAAPDSPAPPPAAEAYVPADTALKVPGAWLRFGHSPEAIQARGSFAAAHVAGAAGYTARRGTVRWFGIESEATLLFRDERLAWVRFSVSKPARHWIDYASDELRRRGYHPRCETNEPGSRRCDWDGATHVRLEADDQLLQ